MKKHYRALNSYTIWVTPQEIKMNWADEKSSHQMISQIYKKVMDNMLHNDFYMPRSGENTEKYERKTLLPHLINDTNVNDKMLLYRVRGRRTQRKNKDNWKLHSFATIRNHKLMLKPNVNMHIEVILGEIKTAILITIKQRKARECQER